MVLHYTLNGTDDHTMVVPDALGVSLVKSYVRTLPGGLTAPLALVDVDSQRVELYGARNRELGFNNHGLPVW